MFSALFKETSKKIDSLMNDAIKTVPTKLKEIHEKIEELEMPKYQTIEFSKKNGILYEIVKITKPLTIDILDNLPKDDYEIKEINGKYYMIQEIITEIDEKELKKLYQ